MRPFSVAVGRGDDVLDGFVEYHVGHHDHGVLRPGQSLHPLAVRGAVLVDVLGHRLGADEGDGLYTWVLEDPVHRVVRSVDDVEDPLGQARHHEQFSQPLRTERGPL
jgi:hypothetical protein